VGNVVAHYLDTTPQRTRLLDAFMAFLVAVGALQFVYCVLAGNYVRPAVIYTVKIGGWMDGWMLIGDAIAVQRLPVGILGDRGAVCADR
jgi:hypothetical protein